MDRPTPPSALRKLSVLPAILHLLALRWYWTFTALFPTWRGSPRWSIKQVIEYRTANWGLPFSVRFQDVVTKDIKDESTAKELEATGALFSWVPAWNGEIKGEVGKLAAESGVSTTRVPGYWYGATEPVTQETFKAGEKDKVVLLYHGGAYVLGTAHPKDPLSFVLPLLCKHSTTVKYALALEYRLASSAPYPSANAFPAALLDAISSYHYLISLGFAPSNIYVMGDSAGGNLALALQRYLLLEENTALGGLVPVSPWVDLTDSHDGPESSRTRYHNVDFVGDFLMPEGYAIRSFLPGVSPENAYISPACRRLDVSFVGFPRTYFVWSELEKLKDEILTVKSRMERDVPDSVTCEEIKDCPHDVLCFPAMKDQCTELIQRIAQWIDRARLSPDLQ